MRRIQSCTDIHLRSFLTAVSQGSVTVRTKPKKGASEPTEGRGLHSTQAGPGGSHTVDRTTGDAHVKVTSTSATNTG